MERLDGVGLPVREIEGAHLQLAERLAERLLRDEPIDVGDDLGMAARRQLRIEQLLRRGEPQLVHAPDLVLGECLVGQIAERWPVPQIERMSERDDPLLGLLRSRLADQALEPQDIELLRQDAQRVSRRAGLDGVGAEQLSELRDAVLERGRRRPGRLGPERVDQRVSRHDVVRVQDEDREKRALTLATDVEAAGRSPDLERSQDPEIQHLPLCNT